MTDNFKILVVDDSAYQRFRTKKLLVENNYRVFEADDGIEAIQVYRKTMPDLVIMDINMQVMEGLDAIPYIRKIDPEAVIIIFSALDDEKTVMQAIRAGAKDYLVKPLKPDLMLSTVKKFLAKRRTAEQ